MDCNWLDYKIGGDWNSGVFGRFCGKRIRGMYICFYVWNYIEFFKIIYVDVDVMLMSNIDELFDIFDDFGVMFCVRLGVIDFCFNVGFMVFWLDSNYYN